MTRRASLLLVVTALALTAIASPAAAHGSVDRVPVTVIGDDGTRTGTSSLVRTGEAVHGVIRTGGLAAGHAYTVWAIVFNDPTACDGPCDGADLTNPAVGGASVLGTGAVARAEQATFVVRMPAGAVVTDPQGAEVHFVVRTHGPAITGLVEEQTSTLNGGCPPNTCANLLVAIHH